MDNYVGPLMTSALMKTVIHCDISPNTYLSIVQKTAKYSRRYPCENSQTAPTKMLYSPACSKDTFCLIANHVGKNTPYAYNNHTRLISHCNTQEKAANVDVHRVVDNSVLYLGGSYQQLWNNPYFGFGPQTRRTAIYLPKKDEIGAPKATTLGLRIKTMHIRLQAGPAFRQTGYRTLFLNCLASLRQHLKHEFYVRIPGREEAVKVLDIYNSNVDQSNFCDRVVSSRDEAGIIDMVNEHKQKEMKELVW